MPAFSPLDILYIVLAFCTLWLSAGLFWLIWQVANIIKNINVFLDDARAKLDLIERSISSMKDRFEKMSSTTNLVIGGVKKVIDYASEKHEEKKKMRMDGEEAGAE